MKVQKLNLRQARWVLYLSRFNFTLKYVLGVRIGKADRLSRRLDWKVGTENDNENQKLIKRARVKDKEVVKVVEEIKKMGVRNLRGNEWKIKGDLVLKEGKVYVPKDKKLRIEIIWSYHDMPVVEHEER